MPVEREYDLVGVVHLPTLPGSPRVSEGMEFVIERAMRDAEALVQGGIKRCIVENFWDSPFPSEDSAPHVSACMAAVLSRIKDCVGDSLSLGVNVLRNDALSALGIACSVGATLIRVNVHVGSTWTDQGLIQSRAHDIVQYRRSLNLDMPEDAPLWIPGRTAIAADIMVKHGSPAGQSSLLDAANDAVIRGCADVIVLTGSSTGGAADPEQMSVVSESLPHIPVWVGSGVQPSNARKWRSLSSGAIVGSYLHQSGDLRAPIDVERVREIVDIMS